MDPATVLSSNDLFRAAERTVEVGFDALLVREVAHRPTALLAASAVLARVPGLRVVAEVPLGVGHPLLVAEEAAVVDVASLGRLALLLRPAPGTDDSFFEAAALVRTALRARPFRFAGNYWHVPANLPENEDHEWLHRTTPAPYQPRMELWCAGVTATEAISHGFGHVAASSTPSRRLHVPAAADDPLRADLARARLDPWGDDAGALVARLLDGRAEFGQDWSIVCVDVDGARAVASQVRPQVQLDRQPLGPHGS